MADLYTRRLWHQLTMKLEAAVALPEFQVAPCPQPQSVPIPMHTRRVAPSPSPSPGSPPLLTSAAGDITEDVAARWTLGAIPPPLPSANQISFPFKKSVSMSAVTNHPLPQFVRPRVRGPLSGLCFPGPRVPFEFPRSSIYGPASSSSSSDFLLVAFPELPGRRSVDPAVSQLCDGLRAQDFAAEAGQGLTLGHFSAQLERFLWDRGCAWGLCSPC